MDCVWDLCLIWGNDKDIWCDCGGHERIGNMFLIVCFFGWVGRVLLITRIAPCPLGGSCGG